MVVRYSHVYKNFPQFVMIHTVKGFRVINEAKLDAYILQVTYFPVLMPNLAFPPINLKVICYADVSFNLKYAAAAV